MSNSYLISLHLDRYEDMLRYCNCCICTTSSELINHFKRNLSGLQSLFCLGKNVFEQKMVYLIGNTCLLQMFYLKIMLRLYHFFSIRIKLYIQIPHPSFRSICYIFSLRSRRKYYSYNLLLTLGTKKVWI